MPIDIVANIYEGFEPLLVTGELVETVVVKYVDYILDFEGGEGSELEFINGAKVIF